MNILRFGLPSLTKRDALHGVQRKMKVSPGELPPGNVVVDKENNFEYEIYGQHPVQAEGKFEGHNFYFRGKWDFWEFTVSVDPPDLDASCIGPLNGEVGFFQDGENKGFHLDENFGKGTDAGEMSFDIAHDIIAKCIGEFRERLSSSNEK